jgi:Meiotically Up-regulated Gene 113 (MUG113) protein
MRSLVMEKTQHLIYFVRSHLGFIKIGYTTAHPHDRLSEMQVGNPHELELVGVHKGTKQIEARLHKRFRHLHVRGEWFREEPDLAEYVAKNTTPVDRRPKTGFQGWKPTAEDIKQREYWERYDAERRLPKGRD